MHNSTLIYKSILFLDADLYETLNEDIIIDQISKEMGSIDSELVSQVVESCAAGNINCNDNQEISE